jgi:hypothetical protein
MKMRHRRRQNDPRLAHGCQALDRAGDKHSAIGAGVPNLFRVVQRPSGEAVVVKYAKELIDLTGAYPGREFRMAMGQEVRQ